MACPPAPYLSVMRSSSTDSATVASEVGMSAVLVPDLAGPFAAHHARADGRVRHAVLAEERAVGRRLDARHDVAADAVVHERRAARSPRARARSIVKRLRASTCAHSSRRRRLPLGTWAMPRQRPPIGRNTLQSCSCAAQVAGLRHAPRDTCSRPMPDPRESARRASARPARMSSGSNPATTTGQLVACHERARTRPSR